MWGTDEVLLKVKRKKEGHTLPKLPPHFLFFSPAVLGNSSLKISSKRRRRRGINKHERDERIKAGMMGNMQKECRLWHKQVGKGKKVLAQPPGHGSARPCEDNDGDGKTSVSLSGVRR